jgi:hypothetical protein
LARRTRDFSLPGLRIYHYGYVNLFGCRKESGGGPPHSKTLARGLGAEGDLKSFGQVDVASAFVEASSFAKAMADETADGDMRH